MNEIFIPTFTLKPPLFNYISLIKVLPFDTINLSVVTYDHVNLVLQELFKAFMSQISSLKVLKYSRELQSIPFINFPSAKDCLTDLSTFICYSDICPNFLGQLSQICHNIQALTIVFEKNSSNGLKELISLQNNLRRLELVTHKNENWTDIIPTLTKHHDTLKKLYIQVENYKSLSFITSFKHLQEFTIDTFSLDFLNEL